MTKFTKKLIVGDLLHNISVFLNHINNFKKGKSNGL